MNSNKGVGRPKTYYDIKEVNEIIELRLKSVGNDINKLTYNSVYKFNQYLVKTKKQNYKKKLFTQFGYSFWAADYKDKPNYGKEQIDFYKNRSNIVIAGDDFEVNVNDVEIIIDSNFDNLNKMKKLLVKLFQKERKNNAYNDNKFNNMIHEIKIQKDLIKQYKKAIFMMFYNSRYSDNSINDVMTLLNEGDIYIKRELLRIFDDKQELIDEIACANEIPNFNIKEINNEMQLTSNILDMAKILANKQNM